MSRVDADDSWHDARRRVVEHMRPFTSVSHDALAPAWVTSADAQFRGRLTAYAARIVGPSLAAEVVQDVFLRLCSQERVRTEPVLAQWLFTVCRRHALDVARKEKRMSLMTEHQAETATSPMPTPSDVVERADSTRAALDLLEALPPNQQECIRLKFQGGLKYAEIASVTGLTETNVGYLIHVGLASIRAKMST